MSEPLAAWTPSLRVFLRRTFVVAVLTLSILVLVGWAIGIATGFWQVLYVGPVLVLAYNVGFEDPLKWRTVRRSSWQLRTDALIYRDADDETRIPLADIVDVRTRLGWSVVIFLKGGMRARIPYIEDPSATATQILAARARMKP